MPILFEGDPESAHPHLVEAIEVARRFGDDDLAVLARLGLGNELILQQRTGEAVGLLDEVMVSFLVQLSPIMVGIAYCYVIDMCQRAFELGRAREWTAALSRWCDSQPDLVPYRGNCLVHRCEIFQLQGAWREALDAAQRACEWLAGPTQWDSLGSAYYQLGEIQRLRGEFAPAEDAYRKASQAGRDPEPGMSLLRLAQGRAGVAAAAIRRVLDEAEEPPNRARVLPAYVEIMLAAKHFESARASALELETISDELRAPYLHALAAHATSSVLLAEGDARVGGPMSRMLVGVDNVHAPQRGLQRCRTAEVRPRPPAAVASWPACRLQECQPRPRPEQSTSTGFLWARAATWSV